MHDACQTQDPRVGVHVEGVPCKHYAPAWTQDAVELGAGAGNIDPMPRLGTRDGVEGGIGKRGGFSSGPPDGKPQPGAQDPAHIGRGIAGEHLRIGKCRRELSRAGADVEDATSLSDKGGDLGGVAGTHVGILIRAAGEGTSGGLTVRGSAELRRGLLRGLAVAGEVLRGGVE